MPALAGLSQRDRRALRTGALVLAAVLGVQLGLRPYVSELRDLRARTARERDLLVREQDLLAALRTYPARLTLAETALLRTAPRLFAGSDLATASAELSNHVTSLAYRHRVFVQQSETRAPEEAGAVVVSLRVELRALGDLEGIAAFLHALETGSKLLSIESLTLRPAERVNPAEGEDEEVLALAAVIVGYALTGEGDR
ncbi:MAG TPA: type II secretion system protein GspM [Gemmatimonadales bacterium]